MYLKTLIYTTAKALQSKQTLPETVYREMRPITNTYINSGYQLVIYPATYAENITISQNNLSIVSSNLEIGGLCNINGNITITSNSTSIRLCGLTMNNLTLSGSANLYIQNCFINGNFSKSGGGYLSMNNIVFGNSSTFSITGFGKY